MVYDINLIPKAKVKTSGGYAPVIISLFAVITVGLLLFGFYLPYQQKLQLRSRLREQENLLKSYSDTQATYNTLVSQLDEFNRTGQTMDLIKTGNIKITQLMNDMEECTPDTITLKTMNLNAGLLTIDGTSPSFTEVAIFIVKLREVKNVMSVTFMSASSETEDENPEIGSNTDKLYDFIIYVRLNSADAFTTIQLLEAATDGNTDANSQVAAQAGTQAVTQDNAQTTEQDSVQDSNQENTQEEAAQNETD